MKKALIIFIFFSISSICLANKDSLNIEKINSRIEILQNKVDEIKRDQLNYSIEKDLIKNTYSNNYDKINLFITGILLLFGFLGFLGLRDINSIKKEYKEELDKLGILQVDIESKSRQFEQSKEKYDKEIKEIIKQNEEQNNKLKVLEIKEKLERLIKERNHQNALEFCVIALEFSPNDIDLLIKKSQLYSRTLKYEEAIKTLTKVLELEPKNSTAIFNLAEMFLFAKQPDKSSDLIKANPDLFNDKSEGQLLHIFELMRNYLRNESEPLKRIILESIDKKDLKNRNKRMQGWDLYDAMVFVANQPESEERTYLQNYIWYLDGHINAKEAFEKIGVKIKEEEKKDDKQ